MSLFGWALGIGVALVGGNAIRESMKPTGEKVKDGDSVFVSINALKPVSGTQFDTDLLTQFLKGFVTTDVKVTAVTRSGVVSGSATGSIAGSPVIVFFALSAVKSIERDGKRIT